MQSSLDVPILGPTLLDPRLALLLPRTSRERAGLLWQLETRLFALVVTRREALLAQVKLAWWREQLERLVNDAGAVPRGEPLLTQLGAAWPDKAALTALPDAYEAAMLAEDEASAIAAGHALGLVMADASAGFAPGAATLRRWGLVRAGQMAADRALAEALWHEAALLDQQEAPGAGSADRALRALERWAGLVARRAGATGGRAEAWLMLRLALGW